MNNFTEARDLQSAIPAAILNANNKPTQSKLVVKEALNLRRKIYEVLMDTDEKVFPIEMAIHLQVFGYSKNKTETTIREMYLEGLLVRTQLQPYAYGWCLGMKVPEMGSEVLYSRHNKGTLNKASIEKPLARSAVEIFHQSVEALSVNVGRAKGFHYGALGGDMDLIVCHLSKVREQCLQVSIEGTVDAEMVDEYRSMMTNVEGVMVHMHGLKESLAQISQMAKLIRTSTT